jgi:signal peptide peptidase SppA
VNIKARINEQPWAIEPSYFNSIINTLDISSFNEDLFNATLKTEEDSIGVKNNTGALSVDSLSVAIIPIHGPMMRNASALEKHLLGNVADTDDIIAMMVEAMNDKYDAIVLDINSPGGTVDGSVDLADLVSKASTKKPVYAITSGMMASAAYWVGANATKIISTPMASVGSIGVYTRHIDTTKYMEELGVKETYISAGKGKVAGISGPELTDEGKTKLQTQIDDIYDEFVNSVADGRSLHTSLIKDTIGANTFMGNKAKSIGLVDEVVGFSEIYHYVTSLINNEHYGNGSVRITKAEEQNTEETEGNYMDIEEMKKQLAETESELAKTKAELTLAKQSAKEMLCHAQAMRIITKELAQSTIPVKLHDRVKVGISSFVNEDYVFDATGYAEAVKAEINLWEDSLPKATISTTETTQSTPSGITEIKDEFANTMDSDIDYGRSLAKRYIGKINSDN